MRFGSHSVASQMVALNCKVRQDGSRGSMPSHAGEQIEKHNRIVKVRLFRGASISSRVQEQQRKRPALRAHTITVRTLCSSWLNSHVRTPCIDVIGFYNVLLPIFSIMSFVDTFAASLSHHRHSSIVPRALTSHGKVWGPVLRIRDLVSRLLNNRFPGQRPNLLVRTGPGIRHNGPRRCPVRYSSFASGRHRRRCYGGPSTRSLPGQTWTRVRAAR
jgi:hypothetical protein